ncbi:MAG: flagellar hook-associated protein FlgK [Bacillota bacterium]|nr:flagellar hook-associated protein FlgK [Bacillota bacterium]MDD3297986.1 flagellar hook-associated protein FlgK [Bacillota bacterium]MDD3851479.1 flagellar hook-associated protein FlgK [Bacillota bacterium]MDD4707764.1 flagellar hook-associated protein FlgK [Bacillota bacterium]
MSSFTGLNIVIKGLYAQQRALDVTGHNIANVNTEGYSRQRAVMETARPMQVLGGKGMLGRGVDVQQIERIRNSFLDVKFWGENTVLGEWSSKSQLLGDIEMVFNEPSDAGLNTVIDRFFSALQDLSNGEKASDLTVRETVRQTAIAFTNSLNNMAAQFEKIQTDANFAIETKVKEINSYAQQISELNRQIMKYELDGSNANDLRDRRNLLVDKLSGIADVRTFEDSDGRFRLSIGGRLLVNHVSYNQLALVERDNIQVPVKNPDVDADGLYEVMWDDGMGFEPKGGELKGLLDIRDSIGSPGTYKGVPFYMERLNYFAAEFARAINDIHTAAYDLVDDGYEEPGGDKVYFFTNDITMDSYSDGPPRTQNPIVGQITAKNITISKEIFEDLNRIAVAASYNTVPGDASKGLEMAGLRHQNVFPTYGTPEDFTKSIIAALGVDRQEAIRMSDNQTILVNQTDTLRMSTSGVSIDEEMANMVKFQHSYNAAARLITAMDEMIDTLVNRMGLVGR